MSTTGSAIVALRVSGPTLVSLGGLLADFRYMSGPKADAILAHAGVDKKKRRKKPKNEDYVGGSGGASGSGLVLMDEDQWRGSKRKADIDFDGDDAPGAYAVFLLRAVANRQSSARTSPRSRRANRPGQLLAPRPCPFARA